MTLSEYLSGLEALDRAATEGPWKSLYDGNPGANFWCVQSEGNKPYPNYELCSNLSEVDAAFIAASRAALPLLCEIVRAQAEVIRLQVSTIGSTAEKNWKPYREAQSALSTLLAELKI